MSKPASNQEGSGLLHGLRVLRNRRRLTLLTFCLVFAAAAGTTILLPKQYQAKVLFDMYRPNDSSAQFTDYPNVRENNAASHLNAVRGKKVLQNVVAELHLAKRWQLPNDQEAYLRLRERTKVAPDNASEHLMIEVRDTDPQLAADIANTVAGHFRMHLEKVEQAHAEQALASLRAKLDGQQKRVELARVDLDGILSSQGLNALVPVTKQSANPPSEKPSGAAPQSDDATYLAARREAESVTAQLNQLKGLELNPFLQKAIALKLTDSFVEDLLPKYHDMRLQMQAMTDSGLGQNHPKVVSLRKQLADTEVMLDGSARNIRDNLQMKLTIAQQSLANIEGVRTQAAQPATVEDPVSAAAFTAKQVAYQDEMNLLQEMRDQFSNGEIASVLSKTQVEIQEVASAPSAPASPNTIINLAFGALLGVGVGIGLAFLLEYLDTSLKTISDVEEHLKLPVLGVIPPKVGVLHQLRGRNPDIEAYRILRTNLELSPERGEKNLISVVSAAAGEGKSTTLVNLAYVCAQSGYTTLLIDADLRRPRLHSFFNVDNKQGLSHFLMNQDTRVEEVVTETNVERLYVLPSGLLPSDPAGVLNSQRMAELLSDVKSRFDLVLVDSPPILGVSDASILASAVDLSLIVVQHRRMPRALIQRVKQAVESAGGYPLGVVLNRVDLGSDPHYQYFTSYYSYYSKQQKPVPATATATATAAGPAIAVPAAADEV